jgi:hypothetical protein
MATEQAYIAATRFGYGPRPGDLSEIGRDPKGWLRAQLGDVSVPAELRDLGPSAPLLAETQRQQQGDPKAYVVRAVKAAPKRTFSIRSGRRENCSPIETDRGSQSSTPTDGTPTHSKEPPPAPSQRNSDT